MGDAAQVGLLAAREMVKVGLIYYNVHKKVFRYVKFSNVDPLVKINILPRLILPPLHILLPTYCTRLALITSEFHTAPELFRDVAVPTSLVDGAVNGFDLCPALLRDHIRKIACAKALLRDGRGYESRKKR